MGLNQKQCPWNLMGLYIYIYICMYRERGEREREREKERERERKEREREKHLKIIVHKIRFFVVNWSCSICKRGSGMDTWSAEPLWNMWPGARRHSSIGILGPLGLQQIRRSRGAPGWDCTWGQGSTKVFLIFLKDGSCWLIVRLIRVNILDFNGYSWIYL